MNLEEVLNFRRSVRRYDKNKPIDPEKVKHCLELATLAPNTDGESFRSLFRAVGCFYGFGNCCFCYSSGFV